MLKGIAIVKKIILFFIFLMFVKADDFIHFLSKYNTDTLFKNQKIINLEYQVVNDDVDIFGIKDKKEKEIGNVEDSFGDLEGQKIEIFYGINDNYAIDLLYNKQEIEIFDETLKRDFVCGKLKRVLVDSGEEKLIVAIGFEKNKIEDFDFKNQPTIGKMLSKFSKNTSLSNNILTKSDGSKYYLSQMPYFKLSNMEDSSHLIYLAKATIYQDFRYDYYFGFKQTHIKSNIKLMPQDNTYFLSITKEPLNLDLSRDEYRYFYGIVGDYGFENFIVEAEYKRDKIFRSEGLNDYWQIDSFNFSAAYPYENYVFYTGFTYLKNQFAAEIPVFYNEITQSTFDKEYGLVYFGGSYLF